MVYRARATEIGQQRLRGWNEFCTGDLARGRLVAGIGHQQVNADQLGVGAGTGAHILQYFEAVFVGPVVENSAQKEDRDVLLGLWVEEVLAFWDHQTSEWPLGEWRRASVYEPWSFTRPDSIAPGMLFFQNCWQFRFSDACGNSGQIVHVHRHLPE